MCRNWNHASVFIDRLVNARGAKNTKNNVWTGIIRDSLERDLKITDSKKMSKILNWLIYAKRLDQPNDKDFKMIINWLKKDHERFPKDL